jgi:hypothetical protein
MRYCDAGGEFNELLQRELNQAKVNYSFLNSVIVVSVTQYFVFLVESESTALQLLE